MESDRWGRMKSEKKKENSGKGETGERTDGQLSTTAANRSEKFFLRWIIIERMIISQMMWKGRGASK
jgi:hypothetical protein